MHISLANKIVVVVVVVVYVCNVRYINLRFTYLLTYLLCSSGHFWRWMKEITIPSIVQSYDSENVPVLGVARLRQIRSRQSNNIFYFLLIFSTQPSLGDSLACVQV